MTFGPFDGASPNPAAEVQSFTLGAIDLTATLTAALVANNPIQNGEKYYAVVLPTATFATLATEVSPFSLTLQGQGLRNMGDHGLSRPDGVRRKLCTMAHPCLSRRGRGASRKVAMCTDAQ